MHRKEEIFLRDSRRRFLKIPVNHSMPAFKNLSQC